MAAKPTINSRQARQILTEVIDLPAPFLREYYIPNPHLVARSLKWMLWYRKRRGVKVVVDEDVLYVKSSEQNRINELTDMIHKLLLHIEDEKLYEEAMKLLEVTDGTQVNT